MTPRHPDRPAAMRAVPTQPTPAATRQRKPSRQASPLRVPGLRTEEARRG